MNKENIELKERIKELEKDLFELQRKINKLTGAEK